MGDSRDTISDTVVVGAGGAGTVRTSHGNDKVTTSSGYVEIISTSDGNDKVTIGKGGAGFVRLDSGNDTLFLTEPTNINGLVAQGGNGTDTLDFKKFKINVTVSLGEGANYQEVTDRTKVDPAGVELYLSQSSFENIKGSRKNDDLTGSDGNNLLVGRGGNDVLTGGKGNDILIGNGGRDVFVFGKDSGNDKIKGFVKGSDEIHIADHTGGFRALEITKSGKNLVVDHDGGTIVLIGKGDIGLSASDFDFV